MNQKRCGTFVSGTFSIMLVSVAAASGQENREESEGSRGAPPKMPNCPVMDEPVSFAVSSPTDDGPVFFCCKHCVEKFKANPSKYAAKVATQRKALESLEKVQVSCPVSGDPLVREVFIEANGRKTYFCSKECATKYEADPNSYRAGLLNSYTFQTRCPVSGEEIDPTVSAATPDGMTVRFCCRGCSKKFQADPDKYMPKLVAQGYTPGEDEDDAEEHEDDDEDDDDDEEEEDHDHDDH